MRRPADENSVLTSSSATAATAAAKLAIASATATNPAGTLRQKSFLVDSAMAAAGSLSGPAHGKLQAAAESNNNKRAALSTVTNTSGDPASAPPLPAGFKPSRSRITVFQQKSASSSSSLHGADSTATTAASAAAPPALSTSTSSSTTTNKNEKRALKHSNSSSGNKQKSSKKSKHAVWVDATAPAASSSSSAHALDAGNKTLHSSKQTQTLLENDSRLARHRSYTRQLQQKQQRLSHHNRAKLVAAAILNGSNNSSTTSLNSIATTITNKLDIDDIEDIEDNDENDSSDYAGVDSVNAEADDEEEDTSEDSVKAHSEGIQFKHHHHTQHQHSGRPTSTYSDDTEIEYDEENAEDEREYSEAVAPYIPSQYHARQQQQHKPAVTKPSPSSVTTLEEPIQEDDDEDLQIYQDSAEYRASSATATVAAAAATSTVMEPSARRFGHSETDGSMTLTSVSNVSVSAAVAGPVPSISAPAASFEPSAIPKYCVTLEPKDSMTNPHAIYPIWDTAAHEKMIQVTDVVEQMPGIFDESDEDTYDITMVAEYSNEIFVHLRNLEFKYLPDPSYMDRQFDVDWRKRGVLVDWLVRVHDHCNLLPETLFLTINYMDRFLSMKAVGQSKLQLVGVVALFLAAKHEEITCPSVQEIAYLVENEYSIEEILRAERYMVNMLDFNMGWPGPMSFLRRSSKADDYESDTRTLAKYLLELTIMDERLVAAVPSWLAAASHYLSRLILSRGAWSDMHVYFSGYTEDQLKPVVDIMVESCREPLVHHKSIFQKYTDERFKWVSLHVAEWINNV